MNAGDHLTMFRRSFGLWVVLCLQICHSASKEANRSIASISKVGGNLYPPISVRIVGGRFALPGEVPHQIGLWKRSGSFFDFTCGGSLIADSWVLTAAHCVWNDYEEMLQISVGSDTLYSKVPRIGVESIHSHARYSDAHKTNDIALLKLSVPASSLRTYAKVISLPKEYEENNFQLGMVSGFGDTRENEENPSSRLKVASLIIRPIAQCKGHYSDDFFPQMQICAGLLRGTNDTCQGDSGGPLFGRRADGSTVILGITSWGNGCGRRLTPGVYTRVSHYLDWIKQTMSRG